MIEQRALGCQKNRNLKVASTTGTQKQGRAELPSVFPRRYGEERKQRKRQENEKDEEEEGEETRELYGRDVICSKGKTTESGRSARARIQRREGDGGWENGE
ncbi:hypothetical protein ACJRO7_015634 [Eucalyptus globulus]|uniref:Uncharacterized protein n=1 Tax=Eucalyptus globulus TaxID=34317 RepID=A0ABD3LA02_EUCGL